MTILKIARFVWTKRFVIRDWELIKVKSQKPKIKMKSKNSKIEYNKLTILLIVVVLFGLYLYFNKFNGEACNTYESCPLGYSCEHNTPEGYIGLDAKTYCQPFYEKLMR